MFFKQYYPNCLAQASYLIGDEESKQALVVDPRRDVDIYLEAAKRQGLSITHAVLTHFHADFIAGHIELRDRVGATIALGARGEAQYDLLALADHDWIVLGPQVEIESLSPPGHTPEGISLLVHDRSAGDVPTSVLTGDSLFIGDVGRPDLMASVGVTADELASELYDSLQQQFMPLADETLVYPGHGAGSLCGRALSSETVSTMGVQCQYNYALQPMSKEDVIVLVTVDQPDAPEYFAYDADINRRERGTLDEVLASSLRPLSVDQVLAAAGEDANGAQILDVREAGPFAATHLSGAINVGLDGQYASWAGTVLTPDRPIVIVAEPGSENEAAVRLGRIGFDAWAGYLDGGMAALADSEQLVAHFDRLAPETLRDRLAQPDADVGPDAGAPLLLDVRAPAELEEGAIDGSTHIPLSELRHRLAELPRDPAITVYCAGGYRSAIAASLLQREGFERVSDLAGGYAGWTI